MKLLQNIFGIKPKYEWRVGDIVISPEDLPTQEWLEEVSKLVAFTPDLASLERKKFRLLFVPDDMQTGFPQYRKVEAGAVFCRAVTDDHFQFWRKKPHLTDDTSSSFIPIRVPSTTEVMALGRPPVGRIMGEVHCIRTWQFPELDTYKRNGVQFFREYVDVLIPAKKVWIKDIILWRMLKKLDMPKEIIPKAIVEGIELTYKVKAIMYIGIPEFWENQLSTHFYSPVDNYESEERTWMHRYYSLRRQRQSG